MRLFSVLVVALVLLAASFLPSLAQGPKAAPGPGAERDRIEWMMTMMGEMQEQMKQMRDQMKGMQDLGTMQGRMARMMGSMDRMNTMMEQHRAQMQTLCPGVTAPQPPKQGG